MKVSVSGMRKNRGTARCIAMALLLSVLAGCAAPGMYGPGAGGQTAQQTGSVVNAPNGLPIYAAISYNPEQIGVLAPGERVVVEQESGDWCLVTSQGGGGAPSQRGWASKQYIALDPVQASSGGSDRSGMKGVTAAQGTLTGAAIGAGLGALISVATGGSAAKGAAIGALIGAPLGLAAGVYVANQKDKYASEEEYLDACTQEARKYNEEAQANIASLNSYISESNQRIAELKSQIARDQSKKRVAQAEVGKMKEKRLALDKVIKGMEGEVNAQHTALASASPNTAQTASLQKEAVVTTQQLEKLRAQRDELAALTMKMNDLTI